MTIDWQTIAVVLIVVSAVAYLGRTLWQSMARRRAAACGGCGNCPAEKGGASPDVVEIQALARVHDRE